MTDKDRLNFIVRACIGMEDGLLPILRERYCSPCHNNTHDECIKQGLYCTPIIECFDLLHIFVRTTLLPQIEKEDV